VAGTTGECTDLKDKPRHDQRNGLHFTPHDLIKMAQL
jgi:hypothetical protein